MLITQLIATPITPDIFCCPYTYANCVDDDVDKLINESDVANTMNPATFVGA